MPFTGLEGWRWTKPTPRNGKRQPKTSRRPTTRAGRQEYALTHPSAQHRAASGELIGFLKPRRDYCITAAWSDGRKEERHMTNKREATRAFEMLTKHSKEALGKYAGAVISLDGKEI